MSFFSFPALLLLGFDSPDSSGAASSSILNAVFPLLISLGFVYLGFTVVMLLQYGYQVLLLRMLRGDYVTFGFLFNGFRERKRIIRASALFSIGFIISFILCQAVVLGVNFLWPEFLKSMHLPELIGFVFILYSFFSAVLLIRFAFVWVLLADFPGEKITSVFKRSFSLLKGHTFKLLGFVLYAGGKRFLIAASIFILSLFVPENISGTAGFFYSVLEFIYFITAYTAAVRMFVSVPLFYLNLASLPQVSVVPQLTQVSKLPQLPEEADEQ